VDRETSLPLRYSVVGAVLGLGAPAGLWLLEHLSRRPPRRERALVYAYVGMTTPIAVGLFGAALGRRARAAARARAELDRLREEFVAVVAHDLRNPIQTILLQTESMLRLANGFYLNDVPVAAVQRLARSAERLGEMVNDLLDASRVEASRLDLRPQPLDLARAVGAVVERLRPVLGSHHTEVVTEEQAPVMVAADPGRLDQIVTNLVENAAKYSDPSAPITIRVRAERGGGAVVIEDRGVGIASHELPRLFDRFYQTSRARARKTGLGLGLYITRGLVEAHGGRIDVRSEPGLGSAFTVWLPKPEEVGDGAPADRG
jgi:signal transduction histidine kinase